MVANLTSADSADKYPKVATLASKLSVVIALAVRVSIFPSTACSDVIVAYVKSAFSAVIYPNSPIVAFRCSIYALSAVKSVIKDFDTFSHSIVASEIFALVIVESLILLFSIVESAILLFVITPSLKIAPRIVLVTVPLACAIVPLL